MAERVAKCSPKLPNAGERWPNERSVTEGRWHAATLSDCREGASMFQHKHPLEGRITGGHAGMSGMGTHILPDKYRKILFFYYHIHLLRMPATCPRHARQLPELPAHLQNMPAAIFCGHVAGMSPFTRYSGMEAKNEAYTTISSGI
jgi:hypothetical protein